MDEFWHEMGFYLNGNKCNPITPELSIARIKHTHTHFRLTILHASKMNCRLNPEMCWYFLFCSFHFIP